MAVGELACVAVDLDLDLSLLMQTSEIKFQNLVPVAALPLLRSPAAHRYHLILTFQTFALPVFYLYQKDERAWPANLQSYEVCIFLIVNVVCQPRSLLLLLLLLTSLSRCSSWWC